MTGFLGMDPTAVRALATQLNSRAEEIDQISAALTGTLNGTQWVGNDASSFRSEWDSTHRAQLTAVASALREASTNANNNANQQEQASA